MKEKGGGDGRGGGPRRDDEITTMKMYEVGRKG